jgi:hypothetical protein
MKTQNLKLLSATLALSVIGLIPMACSSDKPAASGPDGGTTTTHHGGTGNHGGTANQGDGGPSGGAGGHSNGGSTSHGGSTSTSDSGVDAGDAGPKMQGDAGPACTAETAQGCYDNCTPQTTDNSEQFLNHCTNADCTPWNTVLSQLGAGCKKLGTGCTLPDLP